MTTFWIVAGLLVFVAVLFVALPLVRRAPERDEATADRLNVSIRKDQLAELEKDLESGVLSAEQFEQGRLEVERRMLDEARPGRAAAPRVTRGGYKAALLLAVAVPAAAVGLYVKQGSLNAMAPIPDMSNPEAAHQVTGAQLAAMVQRLADRLKDNPQDADGWVMLGRSYAVLHRYQDAALAYQKAYELVGDNPDLLTNMADAIAMANQGEFTPESKQLIERALKVDPTNRKALWLQGTIAYEGQDYAKALQIWQQLATLLPPDSEMAQTMAANIAEVKDILAKQGAGGQVAEVTPAAAPAPAGGAAPAPAAAARVDGTVELDPSLKSRVPAGATLFIFAKAAQGPRMPLAIIRRPVGAFPVPFALDKSMSMAPGMSLAEFPQVVVGARISAGGGAMAQRGDLQGSVGPVAVGSSGLKVVINEVVP